MSAECDAWPSSKLELPPVPKPAGVYKPVVDRRATWPTSPGHGPLKSDKTMLTGRVGADVDLHGRRARRAANRPGHSGHAARTLWAASITWSASSRCWAWSIARPTSTTIRRSSTAAASCFATCGAKTTASRPAAPSAWARCRATSPPRSKRSSSSTRPGWPRAARMPRPGLQLPPDRHAPQRGSSPASQVAAARGQPRAGGRFVERQQLEIVFPQRRC